MATRRLVVVYDGDIEWELEDKLKDVLERHGWEWYGDGTDLIENERDMSFFKEESDDEYNESE